MSCHSDSSISGAVAATTNRRPLHVALVGNPNAGKTTLFNALTGMRTKVGNYPGVTVSKFTGTARVDQQTLTIEDLPGTYSLDPISPDEQVVTQALTGQTPPDAAIVVMDATSLRRSLGLLAQVQQVGVPVLVVLSFTDELARRGGTLDVAALSRALGHRVVVSTAGNQNHLEQVKQALADMESWPAPELTAPSDPALLSGWIDSILREANYEVPRIDERTRRIDAVLLHPVWGTLVFFATMFLFFQMIFTVAAPFITAIENLFGTLSELAREHIAVDWLQGLVADGLIGGVGGVLVFLPQIVLLFLMVSLLEASGYMSRAAFLMDKVMAKAGLEGRAFVAMLSSIACAIPGIMATRALPSAKDRIATMMTAPLMVCSARLPVYAMLIAMLVPDDARLGVFGVQGIALFGMYVFGAVITMLGAWVFKRILGGTGPVLPFYMEMPSYRVPSPRDVVIGVWVPVKTFITKVGQIILVLTLILWAMLNLPLAGDAEMTAAGVDMRDDAAVASYQIDNSLAADIGRTAEPVFEPLGFDWRISVGVIASLGAREVFVSTLGQISSAEDPEDPQKNLEEMTWTSGPKEGQLLFTPGTIAALLVFFAIALQCTSTIAILRRESGTWKWPAIAFSYMFILAWVGAWLAKMIVDGVLVS